MNQAGNGIGREKTPEIWAIAGGKGGVGKSVITTNMAITLAKRGKRCILVDVDLGGANLHTMVGVPNPKTTLSDFLCRDAGNLQDVVVPTPTPYLGLISGSRATLDSANPKHGQKMKLIRHLMALDADYVLLDIGAGSNFNVIDFFLIAQKKIMVVMPTPTSIENAYHFLKAVYFRNFKRAIRNSRAQAIVDKAMEERVARGIQSPRDLLRNVNQVNSALGQTIQDQVGNLVPQLIVNQARKEEDRVLGSKMVVACRDFFGIDMGFLGSIASDERVLDSVQMKRPVATAFPKSAFSIAIEGITRKMLIT